MSDFETEFNLLFPEAKTKESDRCNYFSNIADKTKRDMIFNRDDADGYSEEYSCERWK